MLAKQVHIQRCCKGKTLPIFKKTVFRVPYINQLEQQSKKKSCGGASGKSWAPMKPPAVMTAWGLHTRLAAAGVVAEEVFFVHLLVV